MHIVDIILDGFKSYSQRTTVSGLDPSFNAITGENGSGKSNIFDAICFVMGISSLKKIRVGHKQELVYKSGNSSVSRAIVEIVFDNTDKIQSPAGYHHHDTICVGRCIDANKDRSYINGRTET